MSRGAVLVVLATGCGRIAFDPVGTGATTSGDANQPDASTVAAGNLIAWYWMDDLGSGTEIIDHSGHGHDGACFGGMTGCPTVAAGIRGTALQFDGVDDLLQVPFAPELNTTTGFTVATSLFVDQPQTFRVGVVTKNYAAGQFDSWCLSLESDQTASEATDGPTAQHFLVSGTQITLGTWQHFALTWDGVMVEIHLNGSVVLSAPNADIGWDNQTINIGADIESNALAAPFRGRLDDVRVYNRALTNAEIDAIIAGQ